jgi:hypothetical protein
VPFICDHLWHVSAGPFSVRVPFEHIQTDVVRRCSSTLRTRSHPNSASSSRRPEVVCVQARFDECRSSSFFLSFLKKKKKKKKLKNRFDDTRTSFQLRTRVVQGFDCVRLTLVRNLNEQIQTWIGRQTRRLSIVVRSSFNDWFGLLFGF